MNRRWPAIVPLLALGSCGKVPIYDVGAQFLLRDAAWFAEEETLFVFYEVEAEQGLGEPSVIEITYETDEERVDWTSVDALQTIHTHLPVDCGAQGLCGSTSIHVPLEPRNVDIRLRYHRDGALALDADTVFNVVGPGAPHSHRSLLVYGVFEEQNERVQWRARHQFPTLRNEQATDLGLRRHFEIEGQRYGSVNLANGDNPYGYGADCPDGLVDAGLGPVETDLRAVFDTADLPIDASTESMVCADATVTDALGRFTTDALARKNPEVRPAFPVLRSPVQDATPIQFFLAPCDYTISEKHATMQRQRLLLGNLATTCIDDWQSDGFVERMADLFSDAVEAERVHGNDMVLSIALHRDDPAMSDAVEEALSLVAPEERLRGSPRLVGAFVFDSARHALEFDANKAVTLWCPAIPTSADASSRTCPILPDTPDIDLGPFTFGSVPILASRKQYLEFIGTYSEAQAGDVQSLAFRAPEFATTTDHIPIGDYGVATFLNDELVSAEPEHAFSYCAQPEAGLVVFRSEAMQSPEFEELLGEDCAGSGFSEEFCELLALGLLPIQWLPEWHDFFAEDTYELGILWEFPFLLRMEYKLYAAGSVSAFGLSVPFGAGQDGQSYYGSTLWTQDEIPLDEALKQCTRFCNHPTFDSAGVYHVTDPFRSSYAQTCYLPNFPEVGDLGFPSDP